MTGNKGNFEAATPGQIKDILEGVDLIADPSDPSLGAWRVKLNEITAPSDVAEHFPPPAPTSDRIVDSVHIFRAIEDEAGELKRKGQDALAHITFRRMERAGDSLRYV